MGLLEEVSCPKQLPIVAGWGDELNADRQSIDCCEAAGNRDGGALGETGV
jgi:hypothetical protein